MKPSIILLSILLSQGVVRGQTYGNGSIRLTPMQGAFLIPNAIVAGTTTTFQSAPTTPKYDTVSCIMLVSDTASHCCYVSLRTYDGKENDSTWLNDYTVSWARGYEVGYSDHSPENMGVDLVSTTYRIWHHVTYLNSDHQPMEYFVWDSKSLPK